MTVSTDSSCSPSYATTVDELERYGSFSEAKRCLSAQVGFQLRARSWSTLRQMIYQARQALTHRRDDIDAALKGQSVQAVRSELRQLIGIELPGRTLESLQQQIEALIRAFAVSQAPQSPAERYEKIKKRNFINSSRLEGLEIKEDVSGQTLEQILAEYREAG